MSLIEARRLLDVAEADALFAAGCCQRHRTGEFKQVTEAVLAIHRERVRQAREAWFAAMNGEDLNGIVIVAT